MTCTFLTPPRSGGAANAPSPSPRGLERRTVIAVLGLSLLAAAARIALDPPDGESCAAIRRPLPS